MPQHISAEPLAQMVRSITLQKRTGVLQVEQLGKGGAEWGKIYFENGSLVRARTEHEMGKAALQRIGEWKQTTYTFQSMSRRPYPVPAPVTAALAASNIQVERTRVSSQTDPLARMPAPGALDARERSTGQPSWSRPGRARTTNELNPYQAEAALSASSGADAGLAEQPLVLRGTQFEAYLPAPVANSPLSVQRWTTHQGSEFETQPVVCNNSLLPLTWHLDPLSEEALPGRQAIFKADRSVPVAQAIQQMERRARLVFILLDGQRTIQDIAHLIHQAEYEVEQILMDLTRRGYTYYISG